MPLDWATIADRVGLSLADLDSLLQGQISANVAARLGVSVADAESFVGGVASPSMASRLGLPNVDSAGELAKGLGLTGAVGFLLGLLFLAL